MIRAAQTYVEARTWKRFQEKGGEQNFPFLIAVQFFYQHLSKVEMQYESHLCGQEHQLPAENVAPT